MLLCGCHTADSDLDAALALRKKLSSGAGCSFLAEITADYGDSVYTFELECESSENGDLRFSVVSPDTISGISGTLSETGGQMDFDNEVLAFPMMVEGEISPVSAPWLMLHSLLGGYIRGCGADGEGVKIIIDDSYAQEPLQVDLWLNSQQLPKGCEIMWQGRRIMSINIKSFAFV